MKHKRIIYSILAAAGMLLLLFRGTRAAADRMDETPFTNLIPGWPQMTGISEASAANSITIVMLYFQIPLI